MSKCPKLFEWQVDSWLAHESDKNCFISFSSPSYFPQVVPRLAGGPEEATLLHDRPQRRLHIHVSCGQRDRRGSEEGALCAPLTRFFEIVRQPLLSGKLKLKHWDVLQVVQRLEDDLGVKVQEVQFPALQYGFQIWNTYMGLPDKEGNVRSTHEYKAENSNCTEMMVVRPSVKIRKGTIIQ